MRAILAFDRGWQGMRELSLELAGSGMAVDVLIKGQVEREILAMITRPAGMRIASAIHPWFHCRLLLTCLAASGRSSLVCVVTHRRDTPAQERTRRWLERFSRMVPLRILLLEEGARGTRLLELDGRQIAPSNIRKEQSRG